MQEKAASKESLVKFKKCTVKNVDEVFPVHGNVELILKSRLALNLKQSSYVGLPNVGISGMHYYTQHKMDFQKDQNHPWIKHRSQSSGIRTAGA